MKIVLCSASVLLGALLVTTAAIAANCKVVSVQSKVRSAQSTDCVQTCMTKGWGEDQCKTYCRQREGG